MRFTTTKSSKRFLEVPEVQLIKKKKKKKKVPEDLVRANEGRKVSSAFADFAIESLAKQSFCK